MSSFSSNRASIYKTWRSLSNIFLKLLFSKSTCSDSRNLHLNIWGTKSRNDIYNRIVFFINHNLIQHNHVLKRRIKRNPISSKFSRIYSLWASFLCSWVLFFVAVKHSLVWSFVAECFILGSKFPLQLHWPPNLRMHMQMFVCYFERW